MLDIAISLEFEKAHNDTEPYDDILTRITTEIEEALGVGDAMRDKKSENINIKQTNK